LGNRSSLAFERRFFAIAPTASPLRADQIPDADVLFVGANGAFKEIGPADGVDILTSVGSADFAEYYDRTEWRVVCGLRLPFLALSDLDTISRPNEPPDPVGSD
jgi:hypothetical protein